MKKVYALMLLSILMLTVSGCALFEINTAEESNDEESNIEEAVVEEENAEEPTETTYKKVNILDRSFNPSTPGYVDLYVEKQGLKEGDYFITVCAPAGVGLNRSSFTSAPMQYVERPTIGDTWALKTKFPQITDMPSAVCAAAISHSNGEMEYQGDMYDLQILL
ncbi:MAG: hypothetical protein WC806_00540 [Candidatus Gracilibacteria bacterium]|jgi:hypothetical protein